MNWRECVELFESWGVRSRFELPSEGQGGFDCEDAFTISDVTGGFMWFTTWPGDWILSQEPLRTFFEIDGPSAVGTTGSIVLFLIAFMVFVVSSNRS